MVPTMKEGEHLDVVERSLRFDNNSMLKLLLQQMLDGGGCPGTVEHQKDRLAVGDVFQESTGKKS